MYCPQKSEIFNWILQFISIYKCRFMSKTIKKADLVLFKDYEWVLILIWFY